MNNPENIRINFTVLLSNTVNVAFHGYIVPKCQSFGFQLRYDTIRYDIFTCAQKLTNGQLSLAHGTETKN